MDFGSFIAAFGTGYKSLIDSDTNKPLTKPLFCRELLCNIAKDENTVLYIAGIPDGKHARGETTFQAFYRNKKRRSLHPIAAPIIESNSINKKKFNSFLEMYTQYFSKDKLFYNFKKELPNVSSLTLFDDITNEFVSILTKAAAEPDNRSKAPLSPDKSDSSDYSNKSVVTQIDTMLTKLIRTGRSMAEFKGTSLSDKVLYSKLKNSLHKEFEQFTLLSESLPNCNETADSPIVDEIVSLITSLEETDFILKTADYMIESMKNYHIHRLCALITQLQQNQ